MDTFPVASSDRGPFSLPHEMIVQRQGILATSGAGKSNAAVVMAEAMFKRNLPWIAVDPKGDWWGMRSSRDGGAAGLPIPVLGGLHGDLPLEPTAGKLVADLIVDRNLTCILDVSEFDTRQDMWHFLTDFAQRLLRRNTTPRHVFCEEAADYIPQTMTEKGWLPKCVSAWRRVISHGRNHGLGATLITQRSAKLDKDALDLIDTLYAMRATSARDRAAIKGWVVGHDLSSTLVEELPALDDGEAWVWSPHALKYMDRVKFRVRATFDSGATPLLASDARTASLADIDLVALKQEMADTIERADADDPVKLKAQVAGLRRELALERRPMPVTEVIEVPVPVIPEEVSERVSMVLARIESYVDEARQELLDEIAAIAPPTLPEAPPRAPERPTAPTGLVPGGSCRAPAPAPAHRLPGAPPLEGREIRVLTALAQHGPRTKGQLILHTGFSPKTSTLGVALASLRREEYITTGWPAEITPRGLGVLGHYDPLPTGAALLDYWRNDAKLEGRDVVVLDAFVKAYPRSLLKQGLADITGYSLQTSTLGVALAKLRRYGLVDGWKLSDDFAHAIGRG